MSLAPVVSWIQSTRIATTIGNSTLLTGLISGIHLLGLTLLVGGALVSGLRMLGVVLTDRPIGDVASGPARGMTVGMMISMTSGLLLFAPRASAAVENSFFQIKMSLLCAAVTFHFAVYRAVIQRTNARTSVIRTAGALCLTLWCGVALAGCAFILFE